MTLWERTDFKKVQVEIRHVIEALKQRDELGGPDWEQLKRERTPSLLIRLRDPIILACQKFGYPFLFDETNPDYYTSEGLQFPDQCLNCLENSI